MRADDIMNDFSGPLTVHVALPTELLSDKVAQWAMLYDCSVKSLCSKNAVQRLPRPFPIPGRERVLRTGSKKHIRESRGQFSILDSWTVFFSENGSTRGVLMDDTAALYSTADKYLLDKMSCARPIGDTAGNDL